MATTTNYGWTTPDDTGLVKDGASAIRSLGTAIDTTVKSNADAAINKTLIDAKGDLIAGSAADTVARVAVGTDGQVLTADAASSAGVKWATPASGATSWTGRKPPAATASAINVIVYNGSNLYVAGCQDGTLYSSSDGKTWTARTSGFGANAIRNIAFGNGLWVAVGANGTLTTSSDGITWTARTSQFGTGSIEDVEYANSLWVAVGQNSTGPALGISTSSDGVTWTARTVTGTIGTTARAVSYGNGYWFLVAENSTNNSAYSTNGTTWTANATGSAAAAYSTLYVNGYWITTAGNGPIWYRASTPNGSFTNASNAGVFLAQSYGNRGWGQYNNKLYWLDYGYGSGAVGYGIWMPSSIMSATVSFTNSIRFDYLSAPTLVPLSTLDDSSQNAFTIDSTSGNMLLGDQYGRINTSF